MHSVSLLGLLGKLVVAMTVVVGLMVILGRVMRHRGVAGMLGGSRAKGVRIELLARHQFGRSASIAVVRAAGKALVLGVTEQSITLLTEADPAALDAAEDDITDMPEATWTASLGGLRPGPSWKTFLEHVRERTVRR